LVEQLIGNGSVRDASAAEHAIRTVLLHLFIPEASLPV